MPPQWSLRGAQVSSLTEEFDFHMASAVKQHALKKAMIPELAVECKLGGLDMEGELDPDIDEAVVAGWKRARERAQQSLEGHTTAVAIAVPQHESTYNKHYKNT